MDAATQPPRLEQDRNGGVPCSALLACVETWTLMILDFTSEADRRRREGDRHGADIADNSAKILAWCRAEISSVMKQANSDYATGVAYPDRK